MYEPFIIQVFSHYQATCQGKGISPNLANFLDFLIRHELIQRKTIQQYIWWREYQHLMQSGQSTTKTEAVQQLAATHQVHPNTIWTLVRSERFRARGYTDYEWGLGQGSPGS